MDRSTMTRADVAAELARLAKEAEACRACALGEVRTQAVFGVGNPEADLMFVGEAPGFHEDKQGDPFVGAAGQLLTKLIETKLGLVRSDVYIANCLKCLRYNALVQLGDGSWERVGRLVRRRYDGEVMSVDWAGHLVRRKVIGWHATPLAGRRVFKLTYKTAKYAGPNQIGIQLTGDHEVLTEKGYIPVQDLPERALIATGQGLSNVAFDVVCGTLLGDGSINAKSAHLTMSHSARFREYVRFKALALRELDPRLRDVNVAAGGQADIRYDAVQLRTLAHRALASLRPEFYGRNKRVPAWLASGLTERMLAIWFMDDGYTRIRPGGRQPLAEIAACAFTDTDLSTLIEGLRGLGLRAHALRSRLYFDVMNSKRLSEIIAPFVPPVMRYKLHPEVAESIPYHPTLLEPGQPETFYDEVIVEDITGRPRSDMTFFCIDVEESHNFVTSGGVVHNCRPPGNRDPKPDEVDACRPFLDQQLDLIRPRLVVALGNFAAHLLTGTQTGITRLRGQRFPFRHGTLTCTYHPAAALRGGAAAEGIGVDFEQIRAILDEAPAEREDASEQLGLFG